MTTHRQHYENPLVERYASAEMLTVFSADHKFQTWRKLWIALAEAQKELGLPIQSEQIEEMKKHQNSINYDVAKAKKKRYVTTSWHTCMPLVFSVLQRCPSYILGPPALMSVTILT